MRGPLKRLQDSVNSHLQFYYKKNAFPRNITVFRGLRRDNWRTGHRFRGAWARLKIQNHGRIGESEALYGRFSCCVRHRTQLLPPHLPAIHLPERCSRRVAEYAQTQPTPSAPSAPLRDYELSAPCPSVAAKASASSVFNLSN